MTEKRRGRPPKNAEQPAPKSDTVKALVMCANIHTSAGKLLFRDQKTLPRDEVDKILAGDEKAGREPRFVIL